ncbi:hypothetical protein [Calothrix sp. UHCC 0171]|uniref:hypothetical protein n=1 Tax=Calothrix sp. UHCC 0171 TaxID=3110245 RepID=UPI002B201229|nr:hypothetical protein [Calothrix sp. UHCC 0171]MEA5571022.1 hypothetical protein [Calothrix sp. UHCC 0171]
MSQEKTGVVAFADQKLKLCNVKLLQFTAIALPTTQLLPIEANLCPKGECQRINWFVFGRLKGSLAV